MLPEFTIHAEFILTNVTCQPSTFIVWLQQMSLELVKLCKTLWTVSTWVRLCTSVKTNMKLQLSVCLKQLPTVRTVIRFISRVDSHVSVQSWRHTKCFLTHVTFVRFLSTVNSTVSNKVIWCCKSFATNSTFKRFLSWMTSFVSCYVFTTGTTLATFCALVFTCMNIHMTIQAALRRKAFLTLSTWIHIFSSVCFTVHIQISFLCKSLVTHCTQISLSLVIRWMLCGVTLISFSGSPCTCTDIFVQTI